MSIFGIEQPCNRCVLSSACLAYRSPTPIQDEVHTVLSVHQRRAFWLTILFIAIVIIALAWSLPAKAETLQYATAEHQVEQDRRLDKLELEDSRIRELESSVSRMQGIGMALGFTAILLQLLLLINQSRSSSKVVQVVQEKETKSAAGGR